MNAIQTLGDAVSKLGKQINDLQREVSGRKSHAHRLSLELKQSESWRESLSKDLEALQQSFEKSVASDNLRREVITHLEASNSALSADCNARQAREQEMGTVIVALQAELKSLNDEIKALQFTVEKRNEAIGAAIVYVESLPLQDYSQDGNCMTVPVKKRLLEILSQGAQK